MKLNFRLLWLVPVFLSGGCATVLHEDGALAITRYGIEDDGRVVVDVRVDGQGPFSFAFDTGASISVVFEKLGDELALEPVPGKMLMIHGILESGEFPLVDVGRLELGREVWINPRVALLPDDVVAGTGIDGILGVNFLRRYAVGFSTRERIVRLYPPEFLSRRNYRGWTAIPLKPLHVGTSDAAIYALEITVNEQKIPAMFDLGASINVLNWAAANSLGLRPVASRDDTELSGAIDRTPVVAEVGIEKVITNGAGWRNERFMVADLQIFETLMHRDTPAALLGAEFFNQRDFIIDFTRSRLLVKVSMAEVDAPVSELFESRSEDDH